MYTQVIKIFWKIITASKINRSPKLLLTFNFALGTEAKLIVGSPK